MVVPEVEDDRAAVGDQLGGPPADRGLLDGVLAQPERRVGLVAGPDREGAAVGPPDEALFGEPGQVAPDRLVGDAQGLDQVAAADATALADEIGDHLQPVGRQELLTRADEACHTIPQNTTQTHGDESDDERDRAPAPRADVRDDGRRSGASSSARSSSTGSATSGATSTPTWARRGSRSASIAALEPDDYIVSTHRGHGHAIAKGHDPRLMMAELFGKETGYCHGRGGSMHVASRAIRNLGANGVVAGGLGIATGAALAIKQRGGSEVVVAFCSDGASANGHVARIDEPGRDLGPAGDLRPREQPVRGLDPDPRQRPGRAPLERGPRATACPG